MTKVINVEIFTAPNCNQCGRAVTLVQSVVEEIGNDRIQWRRVDVVAELDHAVAMGVRATPAIAIDGKLVFTALPRKQRLRQALRQQGESLS
ncbi:MAG: thioredoxin family protein [Gammaproteobacteria bacterium]|nr:thioredoxin family protein [Gammaproteobacteria bacterium]